MLRYFKADFYRILRGMGFYAALIFIAGISFLNAFLPFEYETVVSGGETEKWKKFIVEELMDEKIAAESIRNLSDFSAQMLWANKFEPHASFEYAKYLIENDLPLPEYLEEGIDPLEDQETPRDFYPFMFEFNKEVYEKYGSLQEYYESSEYRSVLYDNFEEESLELSEDYIERILKRTKSDYEEYKSVNITAEEKKVLIDEAYSKVYKNDETIYYDEKYYQTVKQVLSRVSGEYAYSIFTESEYPANELQHYFLDQRHTTYGSIAVFKAVHAGSVIQYFILAAAAMFFMSEFSAHTFKNSLSRGFSRRTVYLEKVLGIIFMSVFFYAVYIVTSVVFAVMLNGWHGDFTGNDIVILIKMISVQIPVHLFFIGFAVFLISFFKKPAPYNVIYILLPFVLMMSLLIIDSITYPHWDPLDPRWDTFDDLRFRRFDLSYIFSNISFTLNNAKDWWTTLVFPLVLAAAGFVGGGLVFKRHEVK